MEIEVNDENFDERVFHSKLPVLVDFFARWCGPCRMISPSLEELAEKYDGKLILAKVDVDESPAVATKLGVVSIPTISLFYDGELMDKFVGLKEKDDIEIFIKENLQKIKNDENEK